MFTSLNEQIERTNGQRSGPANLLRYVVIVVASAIVFAGVLMGIMFLEY